MRQPLELRPQHLIALAIGAAAALYLLFAPGRSAPVGRPASLILPAIPGVLFLLHCALALRLRHSLAFLAGLQLGYCALVLLRSASVPLLGLGAAEYARGFAVLLPATLILIYLLGQAPLLSPRSILRVGVIVMLPLLWAPALQSLPVLQRLITDPGPALPPAAVILLLGLAGVLAAPRRSRTLFEFCLAISLVPVYVLLDQLARGQAPDAAQRLTLAWSAVFVVLLYGLYRLFWQRAFLDELTQLGNRRSLEDRLRFLRGPFALGVIDVDHFKAVNDRYGHAEGDNVLRWVAGRIRREFPGRAYRYGGEEFVVILPELDPPAAKELLEELRRGLAGAEFFVRANVERRASRGGRRRGASRRRRSDRRRTSAGIPGGGPGRARAVPPRGRSRIRVTVSVGLAAAARGSERAQDVLERADRALYQAKGTGRNRVVVAGPGNAR